MRSAPFLRFPYGETRTYSEIAAKIGHPGAARAVGRANATNPMPLVIPCHRLIGSDGALRGYGGAGGLQDQGVAFRDGKCGLGLFNLLDAALVRLGS